MRSYGQFCPIAKAAELFCERWTVLILRNLVVGATRFSQLRRGLPLASPTVISRRLKQLEAEGVIERRRSGSGRRWTYHLTSAGAEFAPILEGLGVWGQRWARREFAKHEIDLGLLLWGLELSVNPDAFGPRRCVVKLTFTDQPKRKQHFWCINQGGRAELCLKEPGFEVDLYLEASLPDMIYVYRGDLPLVRALAQGRLEVHGATWAQRALSRWLAPSPLTHVKSQRTSAQAA